MTFDWLQLGILLPCVAGVASSYLPWRRARFWGALLGLAGQPFWIVDSWQRGQGGVFLASLLFMAVWSGGVWSNRRRRHGQTMR
jgi:hypothetical protein